jgi:hypothetical protein
MTSREPPKPTNHIDEENLTALDQNQPSMLRDQTISMAGEESPMDVEEIIMGQSSTQPRLVNLESFEAQLWEIDEAINYIPMQKVSILHNQGSSSHPVHASALEQTTETFPSPSKTVELFQVIMVPQRMVLQ